MALKAGRVGVNPESVDNSGRPKVDTSNIYTKTQADTKFATKTELSAKADQSNLTANSKDFVFAYSGGQYGYKAGSDGAFNPFEKAGVTCMGWVKPADLDDTGLVAAEDITIEEGGYCIDGDKVIFDIIFSASAAVTADIALITGLPESSVQSNVTIPLTRCESADSVANARNTYFLFESIGGTYRAYYHDRTLKFSTVTASGRYYHVYGTYPKKGA